MKTTLPSLSLLQTKAPSSPLTTKSIKLNSQNNRTKPAVVALQKEQRLPDSHLRIKGRSKKE
jgi:hypothetical protein